MNCLDSLRNEINEIDASIAELFQKRMQIARQIGIIKQENDLPIFDKSREEIVIEQNLVYIKDKTLHPYYTEFIKQIIKLSREYQEQTTAAICEEK